MSLIEFKNVSKSFGDLHILKDLNFYLEENSSVSIIGKSGSGKSTFLHLAGGLDQASKGEVLCSQISWKGLSDKDSSKIRNTEIGFIFQSNLLLEDFTVIENILFPGLISGKNEKDCKERAGELLLRLGLKEKENTKTSVLSGGEKQRVAICRALINKPKIILADEPTGSLDEGTSSQVEELLLSLVKEQNCSLLLVTHNLEFAKKCDKVFLLSQGTLSEV